MILIPLTIGVLYGSHKIFMITMGILSLLMLMEWYSMTNQRYYLGIEKNLIKGFGVFYILGAMWGIYHLRSLFGASFLMWILLIIWATDTFAYLVGRWIGGPLLAPSISPGKTWAGALGGLTGAFFVGYLSFPISGGWTGKFGIFYTILFLSFCAQVGDLLESWLKRFWKVKDSGTLIPGHGGLLDRLDSLLFVSWVLLFWRDAWSSFRVECLYPF